MGAVVWRRRQGFKDEGSSRGAQEKADERKRGLAIPEGPNSLRKSLRNQGGRRVENLN